MNNWRNRFVDNACYDVHNIPTAPEYFSSMRTVYESTDASIVDQNYWKKSASNSIIQIDDSEDEEAVIEAVETEPIDDTTTVGDFAAPNEIECDTIATQNTYGANNSNDG